MLDKNDYDQFLRDVQIPLTGASLAGIQAELFSVMKEFFTDSSAWREDILFQARALTDTYTLTPKADGQVIRLMGTWDDKGIPVSAFMAEFGRLKLLHAPEFTPPALWFSRVVKTVVLPTAKENTPIAPDWTLRVYSEAMKSGLLGRMMMQSNTSYSDKTNAAYHLKRFRQFIKIAHTEANAANLVGAQSWAFPRFAGGSQRGGVSTAWPTRAF